MEKTNYSPFYEDIQNKIEFSRKNRTFAELFDISETSDLFDSPFKQSNVRTKEDVLDYIKILKAFIEINDCTPKIIQELLKWSDRNAAYLNKIFMFGKNKNIDTFLDMVDRVWDEFIFPSIFSEEVEGNLSLVDDEKDLNDDIPILTTEDKRKHSNLQFLLLFSSNSFQDYFIDHSYIPDIN